MKLFDNMEAHTTKGFNFSAVRPDTLGATEYTLVTLVIDKTGSVASFSDELFKLKQTVIEACRKSPRSDFLLFRMVEFNSVVDEVHGFKPLTEIDPSQYSVPACHGMTALIDATYCAVAASNAYAKNLSDQDYLVNAIVYVITDGDDNASRMSMTDIKNEVQKAMAQEHLESIRTVLVGVNAAQSSSYLQRFQQEVGFDQFVEVADATPQKLAKLGNFVSQSISSQSQALGTGGPSQALVF